MTVDKEPFSDIETAKFQQFLDKSTVPNSSGLGRDSRLPMDAQGLNWGAFVLTVFWGSAMRVAQAWLTLIPILGFIMPFVLLIKGNEWAWQSKRWKSVEHFREVQSNWALAGFVAAFIYAVIFILLISWLDQSIREIRGQYN